MASFAAWGTSSPKEREHEQDGTDRRGLRAGGGGGLDLFLHARCPISGRGMHRFPGKNRMPDGFRRHPRSRVSQRSIQRLRFNRLGGDRDDAVRARESNERQMAANEVRRAKGRGAHRRTREERYATRSVLRG